MGLKGAMWVQIMIGLGKGPKGAQKMEISDNYTIFCILECDCGTVAKGSSGSYPRRYGDSIGKSDALLAWKE